MRFLPHKEEERGKGLFSFPPPPSPHIPPGGLSAPFHTGGLDFFGREGRRHTWATCADIVFSHWAFPRIVLLIYDDGENDSVYSPKGESIFL